MNLDPETFQVDKICRTCLGTNAIMKSIYFETKLEDKIQQFKLYELLTECTSVEVSNIFCI